MMEPKKVSKRKLPGVEVQFHDGSIVVVHEIRPKDVKLVLLAMPALKKIGDSFSTATSEVSGLPGDIPDDVMAPAYPLLEACTGLSREVLSEDYSLGELMTLLTTFNKLLTKNLSPEAVGAAVPKVELPVPPASPAPSSDTPSA